MLLVSERTSRLPACLFKKRLKTHSNVSQSTSSEHCTATSAKLRLFVECGIISFFITTIIIVVVLIGSSSSFHRRCQEVLNIIIISLFLIITGTSFYVVTTGGQKNCSLLPPLQKNSIVPQMWLVTGLVYYYSN